MKAHNVNNENDFQNVFYNHLKDKGLAGLKFEVIEREYWLDDDKKNRIDIKAQIEGKYYYYELKDYRKLTASQVYYKLGDLFLQLERYNKYINNKISFIKAVLLMPKSMPQSMIQDIIVMFRARNYWIEIYNIDELYQLNYEEINKLR